jgi:hypothetical protein
VIDCNELVNAVDAVDIVLAEALAQKLTPYCIALSASFLLGQAWLAQSRKPSVKLALVHMQALSLLLHPSDWLSASMLKTHVCYAASVYQLRDCDKVRISFSLTPHGGSVDKSWD